MNINASIVDQQLLGIIEEHSQWLSAGTTEKKKSAVFVLLCMSTCLDITIEEATDLFTDGGNDAGVDGLFIGDVEDGEFNIILFQCKYIHNLRGDSQFGENDVIKSIDTVKTLFDPAKDVELNPRIKPKIEEIRSLIRDGYIPNVRVMLCNNGKEWNEQTQTRINQSGLPENQVAWTHFNHDNIIDIRRKTKTVDDTLRFSGEAVVEDFNFRRVLIGKVPVTEIAELFNRHENDVLLERNIRRYLGLHSNRVNSAIHETLRDEEKRKNFYFFNNGITMICRKFRHNALQGANYQVKLEDMQIINGGQTCKTIQQTLNAPDLFDQYGATYVLVRIYELEEEDKEFVRDITYATNSQNPVDLRDLKSNDEIQRQLGIGISDLGYTYKRHREEGSGGSNVVTSSIVAESVLAIWRQRPHQAKFRRREHFGKLYETIFHELNATQALLAVFIFRAVENERKRPTSDKPKEFLPYASHFIAMLIGQKLLEDQNLSLSQVSHQNYETLTQTFEDQKMHYHQLALDAVSDALAQLYGQRDLSLQQLSATFRRGDLLEKLNAIHA